MKATKEQQTEIFLALENELSLIDIPLTELRDTRWTSHRTALADCWTLFFRYLDKVSNDRPVGFGTYRDYKFYGLDDSHIDTVFRRFLKVAGA